MFYVTSLNGSQVEPLINIGTDFKMEQSTDGTFTVSFSCFPGNNPGYDILRSKSVVHIDNYEFIVEQYSDTGFSKSVTAISSFFKNSKVYKNTIFTGTHNLNQHLTFALAGTGWSFNVDGNIGTTVNLINDFGNDNVVSLIEKIRNNHNVEYIILPNNQLRFATQIGPNNDYQYRYKHNVSDVVLKEDTSNLTTVIQGFGAEGVTATYRSPNVSAFGSLEAAPIRDDRFTNNAALLNYIQKQIQDVPELAIESNIPELTARETGERIWLIYEPLNVEMQTRILKQTKTLRDGELITSSVVFGNSLIKTSVDLLVDQKQEIDENKTEVEEAKIEYRSRFDVSDRNIVLQVERIDRSIATIDIKADNINLSVNNRITNEVAAIDIRANQIAIGVQDLDNRTSSSINLLNNNINLKIDRGGAITDINLSPGQATINAERINLNGVVIANGSLEGTSTLKIGTDATIGNNLFLGAGSAGSDKGIYFSSGPNNAAGAIRSFGSGLILNGDNITISTVGTLDFSAGRIVGVAGSDTSGLSIAYSAGSNRLYVRINGSDVGYATLT